MHKAARRVYSVQSAVPLIQVMEASSSHQGKESLLLRHLLVEISLYSGAEILLMFIALKITQCLCVCASVLTHCLSIHVPFRRKQGVT